MNTSTQQEFAPELDSRDFTELNGLIGHEVVDKNEVQVGTVDSIWEDSTGEPAFLTVKTGWLGLGKTLIVPTISAHVRASDQKIRVPYTEQVLKDAPPFDSEHEVDLATEKQICDYYAQHGLLVPSEEKTATRPTGDVLPPLPSENKVTDVVLAPVSGESTKITGDVLPPVPDEPTKVAKDVLPPDPDVSMKITGDVLPPVPDESTKITGDVQPPFPGTTISPMVLPPLPTQPVRPVNEVSANGLPPLPTYSHLPPALPTRS